MSPVEKMAARLLKRHNLEPPYPLEELIRNYSEIEYLHFPFKADGVAIDIDGDKKPQILININKPKTRQKFTLAHELGHIMIPWHTGTIISHTTYDDTAHSDYKKMEAEANRFAAELLIPSAWLLKKSARIDTVYDFILFVLDSTGTSREATLIKVFNTIEPALICLELDETGNMLKSYRTKTAPISQNPFPTVKATEEFALGDRKFKAWEF